MNLIYKILNVLAFVIAIFFTFLVLTAPVLPDFIRGVKEWWRDVVEALKS